MFFQHTCFDKDVSILTSMMQTTVELQAIENIYSY